MRSSMVFSMINRVTLQVKYRVTMQVANKSSKAEAERNGQRRAEATLQTRMEPDLNPLHWQAQVAEKGTHHRAPEFI
jgi:hypothetical protein